MQTTLDSIPTAPSGQTSSRRQFLANLATALPAVALAGCAVSVATDAAPIALESSEDPNYVTIHKSLLEYAPEQPAPYGPAERTALIDACAARVDKTLVVLERLYGFLLEARALPPSQVDGSEWLRLEYAVIDAEMELDNAMQSSTYFEDAIEAATGRRAYYWCLRDEILNNADLDLEDTELEINAFKEDYPGQVAELQALLDARYAGVSQ